MPLSSNSLIHFTKTKTALKGILGSSFKVKYCLEEIHTRSAMYDAAIPMVSFCDIPLSEIKNHIKNYGCYGIGLKKNWARRHGLNPVLYLEQSSQLADHTLDVLYDKVFKGKEMRTTNSTGLALADVFRYIKNYEGELKRSNKLIKKIYRFSDEREWRFCPDKNSLRTAPYLINYVTAYKRNKEKFNKKLNHIRLRFTPDDITYIIIKNDSEIMEVIQHLENSKGNRFSLEQIRRLTTRILTSDQIMTDI